MNKIFLTLLISTQAFAGWFSDDIVKQDKSEINLVKNPGAENSLSGWSETGGGVLTTTSTAANVGIGTSSFSYDASAASDKMASEAIVIPRLMINRQCHASFVWKGGDANLTAQIVNGSATVLASQVLQVNDEFRPIGQMIYPCGAAGETLSLEIVASADAAVIYIDQVFFGIASNQQGALITEWEGYTPALTTGFGSITSNTLEYRRVGSSINIRGSFVTGATSGSIAELSLPTGLTVGGLSSGILDVGEGRRDGTTIGNDIILLATKGDSFLNFSIMVDNSSGDTALVGAGGSTISASTTKMTVNAMLPILEWKNGAVQLINDDVAFANDKIKVNDVSNFNIGSSNPIVFQWTNEEYSVGGISFDGTSTITVSTAGYYEVEGQVSATANIGTAINIELYKNGSSIVASRNYQGGTTQTLRISSKLYLEANDTLVLRKSTATTFTASSNSTKDYFSITRISDFSAGSTSGFAFADSVNYGLVSGESFDSIDASTDATFTDGTVLCSRVGNSVTISADDPMIHSSGSTTYTTAAGFIPEEYRPTIIAYNVYLHSRSSNYIKRVSVSSNGSMTFDYSDFSGSNKTDQTSTSLFTISYVVAP